MKRAQFINLLCFIAGVLAMTLIAWYVIWANYGKVPEKLEQVQKDIELIKTMPKDTQVLTLKKLEYKIEKVQQDTLEEVSWIKKLGIPLTIAGLALLFWSLYKSAYSIALQHAKETVARYYLPDEDRFKLEKKILVLTKEGGDTAFLRKFFNDTGFESAVTIPRENLKSLDTESLKKVTDGYIFDFVFLNNENESLRFSDEEISSCLAGTPSATMIFHFGKPNLLPELMKSQRVASASFKSQIYGNLINALKYQQFLKKDAPKNTP